MPFVGDRAWKLLDYCASIELGEKLTVLFVDGSRDDGPSRFVTTIDGVEHWIDDETDLLGLAPEGAVVSFERGGVTVAMQRVDGRLTTWASAWMGGAKTIGDKASNIEGALLALVEKDRGADCPRLCFYCTHSDYEPSTGFGGGHLACFVESALAYHQVATSTHESANGGCGETTCRFDGSTSSTPVRHGSDDRPSTAIGGKATSRGLRIMTSTASLILPKRSLLSPGFAENR